MSSKVDLRGEGETNLINLMCVLSLLGHVGVFLGFQFTTHFPAPLEDEWEIAVDLSVDSDGDVGSQASLPNSAPAEEAKVSKKLLPQLPKTFELKEKKVADEGEVVEKASSKKKLGADKEDSEGVTIPKKDRKAATELKKNELMKRLRMEKLRQQKKLADKRQAPKSDSLAEIGKNMKKAKGKSGAGVSQGAAKRYRVSLRNRISQHYSIPQTFVPSVSNPEVVLAIVVGTHGELRSVTISQSSKDEAFDQYGIKAAKKASPFERPPVTLAGTTIYLKFKY